MKTVILAGGRGTRLAEETGRIPKPMVRIGDRPILWHIMRTYATYGFDEFVLALGYKGEMIKEYFLNYRPLNSDLTLDLATGNHREVNTTLPDWTIDLVDTGQNTMTGGRVLRLRDWIGDQTFMLTYGDGLADVDIRALVDFHRSHGRLATVTAVRPPARFGALTITDGRVVEFAEKPQVGEGWINGGFLVLEPQVIEYLEDDSTIWEHEPLEELARDGQLMAFEHDGYWQAMDTLREKQILETEWQSGHAPWMVWSDE